MDWNKLKAFYEVSINNSISKASKKLNKRFFTFHKKKRPYIILKWAESKDGFISPEKQNGYFGMTSSKSKRLVHNWRSKEDAILIGRITAEKDNPLLTVREINGKNPSLNIGFSHPIKIPNQTMPKK